MMIRNRLPSLPTKPLEDFKPFQGHLKTLTKKAYRKLRARMKDKGIVAPVYVWQDWIIDGHQRILVCETEGWTVEGGMPYVEIEAADAKEAAEFVLIHSSEYAEVDTSGLYEFGEVHGLDWEDQSDIALPGLDMDNIIPAFASDSFADDPPLAPKSASEYGGGTSIARHSAPLRHWRDLSLLDGEILDFGSGQEEHPYHKYDIVHHPDPACLKRSWDTVLCSYVLNVQPSDHLITEILALLYHLVEPETGKLLLAVRADLDQSQKGRKGAWQNIKTAAQWIGLIGAFFEIEEQSDGNGFFGFICRRPSPIQGSTGVSERAHAEL